MSEDRYTYEGIGKLFGKKLGIAVSFDDEGSLLKSIQATVNSGVQHIEIASLGRDGAARSFGLSSSLISEIRRISKLSNVSFAVHISPDLNLSGLENNGFSLERRNYAIRHAKAAIDFACAINAKLVVLHPNSFRRPISNVEAGVFQDEAIKMYYLIDPRTEAVIGGISEQDVVYVPKQAKDSNGRPMWLLDRDRTPILYLATGQPIPRLATDTNGRIINEQISFAEYMRRGKKNGKQDKDIIKEFLYLQTAGELNSIYLRLLDAEKVLSESQIRRDRLHDTFDYYNRLSRSTPPEEDWRLERNIRDRLASYNIAVPSEIRSIPSLLEDELQDNQHTIEAARQTLTRGWPQLSNMLEQFRQVNLLEEHGLEKLSEAIAEIAEYCFSVSSRDNPVCLTIENLPQPEMFGSATSELLEILDESRKVFAVRLQKKDYSNSESKRLSRVFIRVTLDIAHLNLFRKFYQGDSFPRWMLSGVKELAQNDVISNTHLSDNKGLEDTHLRIGEGNTSLKEALRVLADADYKGFIVVESSGAPEATRHTLALFGVVPRPTDDELQRGFTPRQALYGLKWKDDPERPRFGREED